MTTSNEITNIKLMVSMKAELQLVKKNYEIFLTISNLKLSSYIATYINVPIHQLVI